MTYDADEYCFLCVFFAANRDAMQRHSGYEDLADYYNALGEAIFRKEKLGIKTLEQIKKAIIYSFWLDTVIENDEPHWDRWNLRQRVLLRTAAMLKEARE